MKLNHNINRRQFLTCAGLLAASALLPKPFAFAQAQKDPRRHDASLHRHLCAARHRHHQRF